MRAKSLFVFFVIFSLSAVATLVLGQSQKNILKSNYNLQPGDKLVSPNGDYYLIYQEDGNLVLYDNQKHVFWASNSNNTGKPGEALMEKNGNFVVYNADGDPVWASETDKNGSTCLVQLNDDAGFEIIKKGIIDEVLYSSRNAGWGWNKPPTADAGNWEVDMSWNFLQLLDDLSSKSIDDLKKMYADDESVCHNCIPIEIAFRYSDKGDAENSFLWMKKSADDGNERGSYYLANMYYQGTGTAVNYKKALSYYKFIIDQNKNFTHIGGLRENYSNVQNRIAGFYFFGYGVTKDIEKAKTLLLDALDNGSAAANANWNKYFK